MSRAKSKAKRSTCCYRVGQWVRFVQGAGVIIGCVIYVRPVRELGLPWAPENRRWILTTDEGEVGDDDVLEAR